LGVSNTSTNRYQLKRAYKNENVKIVKMAKNVKEDAPAQAEEDMSDFQKKDEKEDIIQEEEDLKAEEGKNESGKNEELGPVDVKIEESNEVKTALKEEDGEEDEQKIVGAKEEEVTQEMTTFQKEGEKDHKREKDLIQEYEDLTVDTAQEGQLEEDVSDEIIYI